MVTISVIMPVYNGEKFLREAIDSILAQSVKDFEFIIINDGSTDQTENIILSYTDSRIVYIKNKFNLKLIKTLNKGVELAKGKYIARMDADDVSLPDRFEIQLKYFKQNPDVSVVNGRALYLYLSGRIKKPPFFCKQKGTAPFIHPYENTICHPAVMVETALLKNNNYRDDGTATHIEDWELWLRIYAKGKSCITTDEYLLHYRITEGSINRLHNAIQIDNMVNLSSNYLKKELGFDIDYNLLRYIIGDRSNSVPLKDIIIAFEAYLRFIKCKFNINDDVLAEIESWIYIFCVKDLKRKLNTNKIAFTKDLFYFLTQLKHKNLKAILPE